MKKICLTVVGLYIMFLSAYSQAIKPDTSGYINEKLRMEEADLVSGYYSQNGDHSAVTGGIGTQKLNDISNVIDLKFVKNLKNGNKYTINAELGIDHHTAASQANISKTGASRAGGTRIYPSITWKVEKKNGTSFGFGAGISNEFNYQSYNGSISLGKTSKDGNRSINFNGQAFFDIVTLILPSELAPKNVRGREEHDFGSSPRQTYSGSLSLSQVVNKNFQVALIADVVSQNGYLGLPFHRVYFAGRDTAKIEQLPTTRLKIPLGIRLNYFAGDKVIFRTYYRYYKDDWGLTAHTASIEIPYKVSPFFSISPFYRYYTQTAADYFAPYKVHVVTDPFYTSNYDLSAFTAHYAGVNFRITPKNGLFNNPHFSMIELRYGHYTQTTGLHGDNIGINLRFK